MLFDYDAILQKFYDPDSAGYHKYRDEFIELAKNYAIYDVETPQSLHLAGQLLTILESDEDIAFSAGPGLESISRLSFAHESGDVTNVVKECIKECLSEMEII